MLSRFNLSLTGEAGSVKRSHLYLVSDTKLGILGPSTGVPQNATLWEAGIVSLWGHP